VLPPHVRARLRRVPAQTPLTNRRGWHSCETCVRAYYAMGGACPVCGTQLKRSEFFTQTFEDVAVEREVRLRKQILRVYVGTVPHHEAASRLTGPGAPQVQQARERL
jgi:CDK-activating kinase assembly factor MAT1